VTHDGSVRIGPNVVSRRLGETVIAVNLKSNRMLELNVTAARTFELFQRGMTLEQVVAQLKEEFAEVPSDLEAEVRDLIAAFAQEELLDTTEPIKIAAEERTRAPEGWLLRWDLEAPLPDISGPVQIRREPNGDITIFDGWLTDESPVSSPERWDELRGAFVIARARTRAMELVVRRDPTGGWPCYYAFDGRVALIASHLEVLLRRLGKRSFNRAHVAEWIRGVTNATQLGETLFDGVKRLPAGHELTLRRNHASTRVTWEPLPAGFAWAAPEEEPELMARLERAVARALDGGASAIALSGGYDSVSLALMAHGMRGERPPLHAFSVHFAGTSCDEGTIQTRVAEALDMPLHLKPLDLYAPEDVVDRALAQSSLSSFPILSLWQGLYSPLFAEARPLGVTKVLLGTGGDEMFIVDPCYASDLLRRGELVELVSLTGAWARTSRFPLRRVVAEVLWRESLRPMMRNKAVAWAGQWAPALLATWRRRRSSVPPTPDALAEQLLSRQVDEPADADGAYVAGMRAMYRSPVMAASLDQGWEWARSFGVIPVLPFYDQDVVELALRMPPRALYADGYMKTPLRRLVQKGLPAIAFPAKKIDFSQVGLTVLRRGATQAWRRLGGVPMLASLGAIDGQWADAFMRRWMQGEELHWQLAWALLSTEAWLQAQSA
jgi:asparagine synthase (glutamine-hydrolysing)